MSVLGLFALVLAAGCVFVLGFDLRSRHTAFAQFAAARALRPTVYWLGIACWGACLAACMLVLLADRIGGECHGQTPCAAVSETDA